MIILNPRSCQFILFCNYYFINLAKMRWDLRLVLQEVDKVVNTVLKQKALNSQDVASGHYYQHKEEVNEDRKPQIY